MPNERVFCVSDLVQSLEAIAPLELAENWDNVGLLVGDRDAAVRRVMTCLTLTPDVAEEAVERGADLIVSHHPVLFKAVHRLTTETPEGRVLLRLAAGGVSVYSPHTAFDSAGDGINQWLAESLGLEEIAPLRLFDHAADEVPERAARGSGRWGRLPQPMTLSDFNDRVKSLLDVANVQFVGDDACLLERVAVACGSAAEFISDALRHRCEVLLTGEARFHACVEARARGLALTLAGHYATERPAVEHLAARLAGRFPELDIWASREEADPIRWT